MGFREKEVRSYYNNRTSTNHMFYDFYIPILSEADKYDRIAGFFNSKILLNLTDGLFPFINNNGKIRLLTSVYLSNEDVNVIKKTIKRKEENILLDFENLKEDNDLNNLKLLSWLLKYNILEIKISVVIGGQEHQKVGILYDKDGNKICFSGSENETNPGWLGNNESLHVYCSYNEGDIKHILPEINNFNELWHNQHGNTKIKVYSIEESFKNNIIKYAPENKDDLYFHKNKGEKYLRPYQNKALKNWIDNELNGIFEMATGTGKTFTAINCINTFIDLEKYCIVIISCPYNHLIMQWKHELLDFFNYEIIICDSTNNKWKDQLFNSIIDINNNIKNIVLVITTHDTLSSIKFREIINYLEKEIMLVADEVHGIGSTKRKEGLLEKYKSRLGLSATPKRWFDEEGTNYIYEYFKDVVFTFSLKDAINTINESTGLTFLTPYYYYPIFVELTNDEIHEYEILTKKIINLINKEDKEEKIKNLILIRKKILNDAENKIINFMELINSLDIIEYCLIFSTPKQVPKIQIILNKSNILQHKFTQNEKNVILDDTNLTERENLMKMFSEGKYKVLVSIKCLDEGVDIPIAKIAIIMSSSENPKEYIQRRGRVLRQYKDKNHATIYDFIVIPPKGIDFNYEMERKIVKKEIKRYKEFAFLAINSVDCLKKIEFLEEYYKIYEKIEW